MCPGIPLVSAVHPRSRGEHSLKLTSLHHLLGSSPLARGTPYLKGLGAKMGRFIPARAGNTEGPGCTSPAETVHPRSRGEHVCESRRGRETAGSSPLARGTHGAPPSPGTPPRFIPARAGNTAPPPARRESWPVHPRSRGEHKPGVSHATIRNGSSPLARGTLDGM